MNLDRIQQFKAVHTWTGILTGLMLFIAFHAGAYTMLKPEISLWTEGRLPAITAVNDADALWSLGLSTRTERHGSITLLLADAAVPYARLQQSAGRGDGALLILTPDGRLAQPETLWSDRDQDHMRVGRLMDHLHRKAGLPLPEAIAEPVVGLVSLTYVVAVLSGLVILLATWKTDLFQLRRTRNIKRRWLDLHNLLGLSALPFHLIMAVTAAVFCLHDPVYAAMDRWLFPDRALFAEASAPAPSRPIGEALPPSELLQRLQRSHPDLSVQQITLRNLSRGTPELWVSGERPGRFQRVFRSSFLVLDPFTGTARTGGGATEGLLHAAFSLHFGNFGGITVRWLYVLFGLSGALVFMTGNLLWIKSRLRTVRPQLPAPSQPRSTRWMGALTVAVCVGTLAALPLLMSVARLTLPLQGRPAGPGLMGLYYLILLASLTWALWQGPRRSLSGQLLVAALAMLTVPALTWLDPSPASATLDQQLLPAAHLLGALVTAASALWVRRPGDQPGTR